MKLTPIKANMTEVEVNGKTVLFSYETPVAIIEGTNPDGSIAYYKTSKKWSATTTRHINQWFKRYPDYTIKEVDQSYLDNIIK